MSRLTIQNFNFNFSTHRNRKIGFPCPRGAGKYTQFPEKCKGKIIKSHPVTIRSEGNKKRRQADVDNVQKVLATPAASGKEKHIAAVSLKDSKGKPSSTAAKPMAIKALNVANLSLVKLPPPKSAAQLQIEAEKAARDRLRAEIASQRSGVPLPPRVVVKPVPASAPKELKTLDEYMAERSASSTLLTSSMNNAVNNSSSKLERSTSSTSSAPSIQHPRSSSTAAAAAVPPPPTVNAWAKTSFKGPPTTSGVNSVQSLESLPGTPDYQHHSITHRNGTAAAAAAAAAAIPLFLQDVTSDDSSSFHGPSSARAGAGGSGGTPPQGAWGASGSGAGPSRLGAAATTTAAASLSHFDEDYHGSDDDDDDHNDVHHHHHGSAVATTIATTTTTDQNVHQPIPGMIIPAAELIADHSKLTKAQRKNLKRAEKKAAARNEDSCSLLSAAGSHHTAPSSVDVPSSFASETEFPLSGTPAAASGAPPPGGMTSHLINNNNNSGGGGDEYVSTTLHPDDTDITSQCMRSLVQRKLQTQVIELMSLGFSAEGASTAVLRCCGHFEAAVALLLAPDTTSGSSGSSSSTTTVHGIPIPDAVDISEELAAVQMLHRQYNVESSVVEMAVLECGGDLSAVVDHLNRCYAMMPSSSSSFTTTTTTTTAAPTTPQENHQSVSSFPPQQPSSSSNRPVDVYQQQQHYQQQQQQFVSSSAQAAALALPPSSFADNQSIQFHSMEQSTHFNTGLVNNNNIINNISGGGVTLLGGGGINDLWGSFNTTNTNNTTSTTTGALFASNGTSTISNNNTLPMSNGGGGGFLPSQNAFYQGNGNGNGFGTPPQYDTAGNVLSSSIPARHDQYNYGAAAAAAAAAAAPPPQEQQQQHQYLQHHSVYSGTPPLSWEQHMPDSNSASPPSWRERQDVQIGGGGGGGVLSSSPSSLQYSHQHQLHHSLGGGDGSSLFGKQGHQQQQQHRAVVEENELNDLMATLLCR